jgi:hypothetical protein
MFKVTVKDMRHNISNDSSNAYKIIVAMPMTLYYLVCGNFNKRNGWCNEFSVTI